MVLLGAVLFLVALLLLIFSVLDVLTTPAERVRVLPRPAWLAVVVLLVVVGPVAWLVAGRPRPQVRAAASRPGPRRRPGSVAPEDDDAFLRELRHRAQVQREQAERERRHRDGTAEH